MSIGGDRGFGGGHRPGDVHGDHAPHLLLGIVGTQGEDLAGLEEEMGCTLLLEVGDGPLDACVECIRRCT
ncbi:hypothetical protein [Pseudonocardia adelaidensis]|uniref:hypothetical protein n=1 Tax=Pseudonocardia adelaidensis TaxID=648754 RepID=UPI0031F0E2DA